MSKLCPGLQNTAKCNSWAGQSHTLVHSGAEHSWTAQGMQNWKKCSILHSALCKYISIDGQ